MGKVSTNISIDPNLKEESIMLFSKFGLDFSTAITLFLQQSVREQRIPFEIRLDIPNKETKEAFDEAEAIKKGNGNYKRYNSFDEILEELNAAEDSTNK